MKSRAHNVAAWLARHDPERLAVVDQDHALTYAMLDERCARLAGLLAEAGVARGERVALRLGNRSAYLEALFACARLAAIAVPLNNRLAPPEVAHQIADCAPRALLCEPHLEPAEPPPFVLHAGEPYEKALRSAPAHDVEPVDPEEPLVILYTSGTTGAPKGALLPQRKTLFNSLNAQIFFGLTGQDRVLVALPLFHSFGLNILSVPTLYAGGRVVLHARFDPERVWEAVEEHAITFFGAVPTLFQQLLETLPGHRLGSLRFLFTAGAAIPVEVIRAYGAHGLVLKQGYGQTETSILTCLDARDAIRKAGSVGKPVFHAEIRVDAPPGRAGEILVRGPTTMLGYWGRPAETAEAFRDGWLHTGDLACVDDEGFLTLVSRARDMYISGGENVYPAEVEAVYAGHPAVAEIAVVGVPDARWGETGCAWVVPAAGARPDPQALRAWGRERLAAFKLPGEFRFVSELPRTVTGKVQKHLLVG